MPRGRVLLLASLAIAVTGAAVGLVLSLRRETPDPSRRPAAPDPRGERAAPRDPGSPADHAAAGHAPAVPDDPEARSAAADDPPEPGSAPPPAPRPPPPPPRAPEEERAMKQRALRMIDESLERIEARLATAEAAGDDEAAHDLRVRRERLREVRKQRADELSAAP